MISELEEELKRSYEELLSSYKNIARIAHKTC